MKRSLHLCLLICLLCFSGYYAFAQDNPTATSQKKLDPQMKPANQPPHSAADPNARRPEDSSSNDRDVDITPPPGDSDHPGSSLVGPGTEDDVTEMKPWNPHQADKEVEVGMFYFKRRNFIAAERRFRTALYWQDNHAEACYRLGTALEKLKEPAEARDYYQRYLKILPHGEFAEDSRKAIARLEKTPVSAKKAENKPTAQP
jgi:tetratricopeptide (TPR) repeat protein